MEPEPVSTSRVVSHLNQQLYTDTTPEKYATFFLGVYEKSCRDFDLHECWSPSTDSIRGGEATRFDVNGTVVGAFPLLEV